jgi:hypothetical protein
MYRNKIDHPHFGEVWYTVTLRNWCGLGNSQKENLDMGPCFELITDEYAIVSGGVTVEECEQTLRDIVNLHMESQLSLPKPIKPSLIERQKGRFRRWKLNRHLLKTGDINPVI